MFDRHKPAGEWLYPLLGTLAFFLVSAIAVYALTSVWRDKAAAEPEAAKPSSDGLSAGEILDRRLASGEITIAEYDEIVAALARRHGASAAAAAAGKGTVRAVA